MVMPPHDNTAYATEYRHVTITYPYEFPGSVKFARISFLKVVFTNWGNEHCTERQTRSWGVLLLY